MSMLEEREVGTYISKYLQKGLIRPSYSPFTSPIMLVKMKDDTHCMCILARYLYVMLHACNLLDAIGNVKKLSKIDLKIEYYQTQASNENEHKITFRTCYSLLLCMRLSHYL